LRGGGGGVGGESEGGEGGDEGDGDETVHRGSFELKDVVGRIVGEEGGRGKDAAWHR
jgi:hypothetical protein